MKPRILISRSPESSGLYEAAVEKAGGEPLSFHCPDIEMEFDALILAGGGDVDPRVFMERNLGSYDIDFPRDQAEIALVNRCIYENKPILGICRGIQVMNVALGGTLIQDISDKQIYPHSDFPNRGNYTHPVRISEDTRLYKIMKTKMIMVNSMHHQVVDELGEKLKINAISPDGYIEGIELKDHPFCIGVQWHPEHMVKYSSFQKDLFSEFVQTCKK